MKPFRARRVFSVALMVGACGLGACATTGGGAAPSAKDPYEGFNRKVYAFNEKLDQVALKPIAEGYRKVVPQPVRNGVVNFFGNLSDAWSSVNELLQGKVETSARMGMRFASNTVFGLGGILDPATEMGLQRESSDFGLTLGHWGFGPGPYLVLPLLGPSNLRDTAALPLNVVAGGPSAWIHGPATLTDLTVLNLVSTRAGYLSAGQMLDEIALDKYSFLRDAYLARRRSQVFDGNPPDEPEAPEAPDAPQSPQRPVSAASSPS